MPDVSIIWWMLLGWMVDDDFNINGLTIIAVAVALAAEASDDCDCSWSRITPRKGGTGFYALRHNACADNPLYTDFPGSDIDVRDTALLSDMQKALAISGNAGRVFLNGC